MDSQYNHKLYEDKIYRKWEASNAFKPNNSKKTFSIVLPPPNANAPLHYGHAMYTVEDILIRYHRMLGDSTLWLPGADHAGFETQVVYEKALEKEGKSRFDYNRDTLYKNIWEFVHKNRGTMEDQLKKLGFSLDWSRLKFTLDKNIVKIVYQTFKKLYDQNLIYRDIRLVNYCTKHGTAFSDLEVDHKEEISKLYYLKYGPFTLATTRPETKFADTAVAVHPNDKRYRKFIGKEIEADGLLGKFKLKVIADTYVDPKFGTGVVKITPYHDVNDYEVWLRHKDEMPQPKQVIGFDGKLTEVAGKYQGLRVKAGREIIINDLEEKGLLVKVEDHKHTVGSCYKCGTVLEPLPLEQWFIKTKELAKPAIEAVKKGKTQIVPKRFEKTYFQWLGNTRDWNISRQIVWGIRIPAWKCDSCNTWIVTLGEQPQKCSACKSLSLSQDPDTFDTWFSSGQWPFATLRASQKNDFEKFYPISVMETAYDILFFWVARMMMLGIFATGEVPFKTVYLHGIVRDSKGVKMSKSKGNVINPLGILDKYGADALRMSLIAGAGAGNDQNYSEEKVIGYRNFANKIWNATRFVLQTGLDQKPITKNSKFKSKIEDIIKKTTKYIEKYQLNRASETLYANFWHWYCDICIENYKKDKISSEELRNGLEVFLKLLHPFMPFVTEACWTELKNKTPLINSPWPTKFA